ncbi:LysR family transcriptional regulator [Leptotrichia trevisanii]|uniref:LysR family transcriptional regulator n=1 Tax=Leptotrichia trevisanii TaxID=109328 RepID=A0A510KMK3_9FUSO|nr:LysR family transcriptional regulator [Leptotrichia trevisanii]BBM51841.1 LysR family transcriptional regulator [Leptotrichia trevisanii]
MELRILKYFLMVAKEENITKAAKSLYITQPTLSRQLAQLEEELGVKLFTRSNHKILLTEDGKFLQRRAREILYLTEKTKKELSYDNEIVAGEISIGCGEFLGMNELSKLLSEFQEKYPNVKFDIYSGTAEDIIYRIEHGFLDMGLVFDYINKEKYKFIRLKNGDFWLEKTINWLQINLFIQKK